MEFEAKPTFPPETSGRLELGKWLADPRHPLSTRVLANRLFHWTFGVGIVRTPDNFGTTGEEPTNPALLEYLAADFAEHDWSTKHLVRQLVLSRTYRSSVVASERAAEIDPENKLFSHAIGKRLEVEALRDAMLVVSGELRMPGAESTLKAGLKEDYRYQHVPDLRSVYQPVLRNSLPELYEAFDFPNPSVSSGVRSQSVVAPQALALLNSNWVHQRARSAATRIIAEFEAKQLRVPNDADWSHMIKELFVRCLGREPNSVENYTALSLVDELKQKNQPPVEILTRLVHGLFASIDFRYLD